MLVSMGDVPTYTGNSLAGSIKAKQGYDTQISAIALSLKLIFMHRRVYRVWKGPVPQDASGKEEK